MGMGRLIVLFNDVKFSFNFANTHVREGLTTSLRNHARRHSRDRDRIRDTDEQASGLAQFRDSIRHNSTGGEDSDRTGTDDYVQMVDILIRRGGVLDHYAGPLDVRDWADAKNLKGQFENLLSSRSAEDIAKSVSDLWNNKFRGASLSVARTALHSAVSEIQASASQEIAPAVMESILTTIVTDCNAATVEAFGEEITVEDFKKYLGEVGDGITSSSEFKI